MYNQLKLIICMESKVMLGFSFIKDLYLNMLNNKG